MIFKSDEGKPFNQEQAIDLLVSLVATDANSEKKWRGFYNSLSSTELQDEWDDYWKTWRDCKAQKNLLKGRFSWRSRARVSLFPLLGGSQLLTVGIFTHKPLFGKRMKKGTRIV